MKMFKKFQERYSRWRFERRLAAALLKASPAGAYGALVVLDLRTLELAKNERGDEATEDSE